ncbi:MAG: hypothetical protein FWF46_04915 [Oscillospiraceae bacterium]|nr:hypothetical protein [Oscillospiraceae bacterium]
MEFVRRVVNGSEIKGVIDIPNTLVDKKLEVLIFPVTEYTKKTKKRKSLSGFLSEYAKPELICKEENAWYEEAKE